MGELIFAAESVTAIVAITTDRLIADASHILAIPGRRAAHFARAAMIQRFKYLEYALGAVRVFIGSKTRFAGAIGLLAGGVLVSSWKTRGESLAWVGA